MSIRLMNVPERNRFVQAIQHEVGVAADMRTLSRFVREQIFYVFVHDFKHDKDDCLSAEGEVCQELSRATLMLITMKIF